MKLTENQNDTIRAIHVSHKAASDSRGEERDNLIKCDAAIKEPSRTGTKMHNIADSITI
jgi:hypothetical protein